MSSGRGGPKPRVGGSSPPGATTHLNTFCPSTGLSCSGRNPPIDWQFDWQRAFLSADQRVEDQHGETRGWTRRDLPPEPMAGEKPNSDWRMGAANASMPPAGERLWEGKTRYELTRLSSRRDGDLQGLAWRRSVRWSRANAVGADADPDFGGGRSRF